MTFHWVRSVVKNILPSRVLCGIQRYKASRASATPLSWALFGCLRRVHPVSKVFGYDRDGVRIGRYYIEQFLSTHHKDIYGHVLEIGDSAYTRKYGGAKVTAIDVLNVAPSLNPEITIVGNLVTGEAIPIDTYDCMILTQVFPFIYEIEAAVNNCWRALKPGGVLLVTLSGISQISRYDSDRWGDYWRFTDSSAERLFSGSFGQENVKVTLYGNVLSACAVLHGLLTHELTNKELNHADPDYQVIIGVRAEKRRC